MSEQMINDFINKNYMFLLSAANNITKTKRKNDDEGEELLSFLVEQLHAGKVTVKYEGDQALLKICVMFLRNQFNWPLSSYNQLYHSAKFKINKQRKDYEGSDHINECENPNIFHLDFQAGDGEEASGHSSMELELFQDDQTRKIELQAEYVSDAGRDYILDLMSVGYDDDQIKKILNTYIIYKEHLTPAERKLYDLYFKDDLFQTQIADKIRLNKTAVHLMLKDLKNKINKLHNGQ